MSAHCRVLGWDTDFFGVKVASVEGSTLDAVRAREVDDWCAVEGIECLYFLASASDAQTIRTAEDHSYRLMDVRLTFARKLLASPPKPPPTTATLRLAGGDDLPELEQIAMQSYTDSRYYYDPCFPRERCDALYATWIRNSVNGYADAVHVAMLNGLVVGFISCHLHDTTGNIGLVGVGERARGQGIGGQLVTTALNWFAGQGANSVTVVTQGRNVAAQRLYQQNGFMTQSVQFYYHKWFRPCP